MRPPNPLQNHFLYEDALNDITNRKGRIDAIAASRRVGRKEKEEITNLGVTQKFPKSLIYRTAKSH